MNEIINDINPEVLKMNGIINYVNIIISYITDIFYNNITALYVIRIGFGIGLSILLSIIKWRINIIKKYIWLLIIYIIILCIFIMLMLINYAGEDCEHMFYYTVNNAMDNYIEYDMLNENSTSNYSKNTTHCMADQGWERYFLNTGKDNIDLENSNKNELKKIFTSNIPELQNEKITKDELLNIFNNSHSRFTGSRFNYQLYTKHGMLDYIKFEKLGAAIINVKLTNSTLNLKWWNLCHLYSLIHYKDIPFDINDIKSYSPETFYEDLVNKDHNKSFNSYWKRELNKYKDSQNEFYSYMRIIHSVIDSNNK